VQHEFNNRVAAQRAILRVVNVVRWPTEPLLGLSSKAIARWISANRIEPGSRVAQLVQESAAKLFFLANKSQEQISEEYSIVRAEIMAACELIRSEMDTAT